MADAREEPPTENETTQDIMYVEPLISPERVPSPERPSLQVDPADFPLPTSAPGSIAGESVASATPTLGGTSQTQITNVVAPRGFTPRPSTSDKPHSHELYANIPTKPPTTKDTDNESQVSRSTAQRTNFSSTLGGTRRPPSRSHVPAIMPAYSFYHPLRPQAVC